MNGSGFERKLWCANQGTTVTFAIGTEDNLD
jgi:hypothetical protein